MITSSQKHKINFEEKIHKGNINDCTSQRDDGLALKIGFKNIYELIETIF